MGNINDKFRSFIRNLRRDKGYTQLDVAEDTGISVRYYQYLESGQRKPSLEMCEKLARAFEMSLSEFCHKIENY